MSSDEEIKVLVDGKLISFKDFKNEYNKLIVPTSPGVRKIMKVLSDTKKPLTRHDIAEGVNLTPDYVTNRLKNLAKSGYVVEFKLSRSRFKYYLLTEKGLKFLNEISR